jgi:hypothetical protein
MLIMRQIVDHANLSVFLIGIHGHIEGATRLQKYAFLSAM